MSSKNKKNHSTKSVFCIWITFLSLVQTACGNDIQKAVSAFDGQRAFTYLEKQCEFGPRVPGTQAHQACLQFLTSELKSFGAQVSLQNFTRPLATNNHKNVTMTNVIASFAVNKGKRILLCAHWDTRPWADQDTVAENQNKPILGANDGASGVAVLLEVARVLQEFAAPFGVDIILFDGEDSGLPGNDESYALGSQFFARNKDFRYRPALGILLDMVGDKNLQIYKEENSIKYAPHIVDRVWQKAQALGLNSFIPTAGYQVTDDHLPLLKSGIPCIDIIDFDYEHWHTLQDTPDKCSAESLKEIGTLILGLIYDEALFEQ
ncbi:MAG: M28 family peptidase [bacterium]